MSMIMKRSQRNMLKARGSNMDPCGTPSKISAHELYFELTLGGNFQEPVDGFSDVLQNF